MSTEPSALEKYFKDPIMTMSRYTNDYCSSCGGTGVDDETGHDETCSWLCAKKEIAELRAWKDSIEEYCILDFIPMTTPDETIKALLEWNIKMALDPAISQDAQALIEKGRNETHQGHGGHPESH